MNVLFLINFPLIYTRYFIFIVTWPPYLLIILIQKIILFQLYQGFTLPIIDYCDTIWIPPTALLSKSMDRIHARFVSHMSNDVGLLRLPWQNATAFIQLFKCIKFYISFYVFIFRICLHFLIMLPDMLAGTVIACLFLECGLLMDKRVYFIEGQ